MIVYEKNLNESPNDVDVRLSTVSKSLSIVRIMAKYKTIQTGKPKS